MIAVSARPVVKGSATTRYRRFAMVQLKRKAGVPAVPQLRGAGSAVAAPQPAKAGTRRQRSLRQPGLA
ncbi:hypothetical protein OH407_24000 [Salmonella enterica]|uniref:hypothetical protein n=1 Tax=Salmonella enterica TaxID=28901 RepID=UPI0022B620BF|nr:hypothetical protein [Salmonella enterica]MCZ6992396.1 hypothetical protein [Salmonella enterica]